MSSRYSIIKCAIIARGTSRNVQRARASINTQLLTVDYYQRTNDSAPLGTWHILCRSHRSHTAAVPVVPAVPGVRRGEGLPVSRSDRSGRESSHVQRKAETETTPPIPQSESLIYSPLSSRDNFWVSTPIDTESLAQNASDPL